jgi:hypothetical protein
MNSTFSIHRPKLIRNNRIDNIKYSKSIDFNTLLSDNNFNYINYETSEQSKKNNDNNDNNIKK